MATTIKDIAKIAGVSHTTVSRALNDSPLISDKTKEKIKKIALENNYEVNTSAKSLKLRRSFNIGIFFSTLESGTSSNFFFNAMMGAKKAVGNKYNLIVHDISDFYLTSITKRKFDGIVLISQSDEDISFVEYINQADIPLVIINRKFDNIDNSQLLSDDLKGSYTAVEYLIKQGHKRIGTILGKEGFINTKIRYEGYKDALKSAGINIDIDLVKQGDYSFKSGYDIMNEFLTNENIPTAIFCANDEMAIGAIKSCIENGLKVPEDISFIGYDESEMSKYTTPALTTVSRKIDIITGDATKNLIDLIEGSHDDKVTFYEAELIIRDSVSKI